MGHGGLILWPTQSPDLLCLDFCIWSHMKAMVHETPAGSEEDLVSRTSVATGDVPDIPGIFDIPYSANVKSVSELLVKHSNTFYSICRLLI
ncbi:hypothetical protein AVEN_83984-1 [Araneus ventricosus]|uniref:Uncharacterized protein n=1 Tax=Araneus ventricosus TaxID=182803 RepID=A0A4Y2BSK8_ARAVE|nr:hypothetical protein AVEN_83984-1 [Araneus ventricosus]